MKSCILYLTIFIAASTGCKESNYAVNENKCPQEIILRIDSSFWFTSIHQAPKMKFGHVHLVISGKTNAERVTVLTYGDGLRAEFELKLTNGMFNDTIAISFSPGIPSDNTLPFYSRTHLKAYSGSSVFDTTLHSGPLRYTGK